MSDPNKIERGDTVTVFWAEELGDWRGVIFQSGPGGAGDTYHLLVNGDPVLLNGNSSEFAFMRLEKKGD